MTRLYFYRDYDDETGAFLGETLTDAVAPEPPPDPEPEPQPNGGEVLPDEWHEFDPKWRVGASGGLYANPGTGKLTGWYKEAPVKLVVANGDKVDVREIEIFIELEGINPQIPDGEGFEFELPAEITPADPHTGRGGGGDLWILGGSNHFSISLKWTDRKDRPMRLLVILGNGEEWTTNVPKVIPGGDKATVAMYAWMKYLA